MTRLLELLSAFGERWAVSLAMAGAPQHDASIDFDPYQTFPPQPIEPVQIRHSEEDDYLALAPWWI